MKGDACRGRATVTNVFTSFKTCQEIEDEMYSHWGKNINRYALDYPVCKEEEDDESNHRSRRRPSLQALSLMGNVDTPDEDVYYPCETGHLIKYLNRKDVQIALHAKLDTIWTICAKEVVRYYRDGLSKVNLYRELVDMGIQGKHSLSMLIYSGDDDSVCSTAGTQEWIYDLGVEPREDRLWKAWKANGQTAGFATRFDLGNAEASLTFVTVHGAGHEVPSFRPIEALEMFQRYLRGEW